MFDLDCCCAASIGDSVNLASRLEGLNKVYGTSIIISGAVHNKVEGAMVTRLLDFVVVKGKSKAVRIYELLGKKEDFGHLEEDCNLFKRAFEQYLRRHFKGAIAMFEAYLQKHPGDKAALRHINTCRDFIHTPPPPTWNGAAHVEEK